MAAKIIKILSFVSIILMLFILLSGCEGDTVIIAVELVRLPDRIIYMANTDNELDFSGLTVSKTNKRGDVDMIPIIPTSSSNLVSHNINFLQPGVYEITIIHRYHNPRGEFAINFWVQVVDGEVLDHIRNGTFDEIASPWIHGVGWGTSPW